MKVISKRISISLLVLSTFSLAACSPQAEKKSASADANAVVQEKTSNVAVASADTPAEQGFSYAAVGSEPDWAVNVQADNTLIFSTPENIDGVKLTAERNAYAKGVEYTGMHDGQAFSLNLNGTTCNDSMSDTSYDMTATFEFNGQTYKGCATIK